MNKRTRLKKFRQLRNRAIGISIFLFAATWAFWLIVPNDFVAGSSADAYGSAGWNQNSRGAMGGGGRDSHGTAAVGVLGEKFTAESDSSNYAPPYIPSSTSVPEPTTLLLLAPAALLMMRRNRRAV